MEKGFLDIFYDPTFDGIFSRNVNSSINGINSQNLLYAKGYYLNAHGVGGFNKYRGDNVNYKKREFCGVESGEGLAKLQPGMFQAFGQPFKDEGSHSVSDPTMSGVLTDPENVAFDIVSQPDYAFSSRYSRAYPKNIPTYNDPTFPDSYNGALRGLDITGDGYGYFPVDYRTEGEGDVTGGGLDEDDCVSNVIDISVEVPRGYRIGKRVLVVSEHFRPFYRKFGRCVNNACNSLNNDAKNIKFMDINGVQHNVEILAGHFCGDPYDVDPEEAGMPVLANGSWQDVLGGNAETLYESRDWYDNIFTPQGFTTLPQSDYCVYITAEDIPDGVPTFRPITESFITKYFNETANPSTSQSVRNAVHIDQMGRMILSSVQVGPIPPSTDPSLINSVHRYNLKSVNTGDETDNVFTNQIAYKVGTSAYYVRMNSYTNSLTDQKSIVTSDIPQITELHHFDYDFRDYASTEYGSHLSPIGGTQNIVHGVRVGDSSSCVLFPLEDISGNKFFGYWGQQVSPSYPQLFGKDWFVESLNFICDAYGIDRVEWLDDTVDVSPSITPQDIRPTLGYKVYKSSVGKDGPFFDITDQVVPYNRNVLTSQVVGMPCIDPDVPCYTIHENFIDEFVVEGDVVFYYVTRIEDNGVGGYYESDPSEVIQVTVPSSSNQWSDTEERYLSRDNASSGVLVGTPAINDEALNIPTSRTVRHLFDGYRMESDVNVPMLGYRSGVPNALGIGQIVATDPTDREFYYRLDNPEGDNDGTIESILPFDNTSYQYILGTPSSSGEINYQFKMFVPTGNTELSAWSQGFGKDIVLTKYDPVKNVNEAYMHSRIYPSAFGLIGSLHINPRGYGHKTDGASDWDLFFFDERTSNPDSITGFKMGDYFSQDLKLINNSTGGGNFNLFASGNASDTSYATGSLLDWIDASGFGEALGDFDVSNNGLYALKTSDIGTSQFYGETSFARRINISNNRISSQAGDLPDWRTDVSFGQSEDQWTDKNILVREPTTYINANNAGDFALEIINKNDNVVEYVDMSRTLVATTSGSQEGIKSIRSKTIQNLFLDDMKKPVVSFPQTGNIPYLNFQACGYLESISAKIDSNAEYANGSQGYGLIYFLFDPDVNENSSQCGWANLKYFDLSCNGEVKHTTRSINLGYSHSDTSGWNNRYNPLPSFDTNDVSSFNPFQDKEFESPHFHGNLAPNLEYVNVSGMTSLVRLHLPKVSSEHDLNCTNVPSNRTYLNYVNVSNTQLGIDESLEEFLGDAIEGYSINTPAGYTLTVVAENVKDQNGVVVRTPESVINSIKTAFSNQGKTFIFVGETSAG